MSWIKRIHERLDLPAHEKDEVLEELTCHFEEQRKQLIAAGKTAEEAESEAGRILGDPREVAAALQSVHTCSSWKLALLSGVPFLLFLVFPIMFFCRGVMDQTWGVYLDISGSRPEWVLGKGAAVLAVIAALLIFTIGVRLLSFSLREIRNGHLCPLVATSLAVGISLPMWILVLRVIYSPLLQIMHIDPASGGDWSLVLGIVYAMVSLIIAVISTDGVKSWPSWVSASIGLIVTALTLAMIAGSIASHYMLILTGLLVTIVLFTGWRVFSQSSYWSLFSFSIFISFAFVVSVAMLPCTAVWRLAGFIGIGILTAGLSLVVFSRCSDWRLKKLALLPGILIGSLLIAFADDVNIDIWRGIVIAEQCALIASIFVYGVPALEGLIVGRRQPISDDQPLYEK